MHNATSWQAWAEQLCAHVHAMSQRVSSLEQTIAKLQKEVTDLKERKTYHIDKIEYNFDQLKVERLEGTLSIGINPGSLDGIEDFTVNGATPGQAASAPSGQPSPFDLQSQITQGIDQYLQQDVFDDMQGLEEKHQYPLDSGFREFILEDIQKQVAARIRHYVQQYRSAASSEPLEAVTAAITEKTKNDIRAAIDAYLANLPKRGGEAP